MIIELHLTGNERKGLAKAVRLQVVFLRLMSSMNLFLLQQMTERCPIRMDPWNISHGRRFVVNIVFLKMELST